MIKVDVEEPKDLDESYLAPDPNLMSKTDDIADENTGDTPPRRTPKDTKTRPKGRKRRRSEDDASGSQN